MYLSSQPPDESRPVAALRLEERWRDPRAVTVAIGGDLDLATAGVLAERLGEVIERGARRVVVDVDAAAYLDSSALAPVLAAHRRLLDCGGALTVLGTTRRTRRILSTLAGDLLPRVESAADAERWLERGVA